MRNTILLSLACAVLALSSCHKDAPKQAEIQTVFPTLPLPPEAQLLTKDAGTDAVRLVMVTPVAPDSIVSFYRNTLSNDPFHLVNDQVQGKTTSLYAERDQNGPPIWVTVSPNGTLGSQVMIAGGATAVAASKTVPASH